MELVNFSQAADNNQRPILAELQKHLSKGAKVLEIGSGSGQHTICFATAIPDITWQPTDQGDYFPGLETNIRNFGPPNSCEPLYLDLNEPNWPQHCDYLYSANVIHIMPEALLPQIFASPCDTVLLYGPYKYNGEFTSESNARFDIWLKNQHPLSGVRDIENAVKFAEAAGYTLKSDIPMPANNQFLVFNRA